MEAFVRVVDAARSPARRSNCASASRRFQDSRAARGPARRAPAVAFDTPPDPDRSGPELRRRAKRAIEEADEAEPADVEPPQLYRPCAHAVTFTRLNVMSRLSIFSPRSARHRCRSRRPRHRPVAAGVDVALLIGGSPISRDHPQDRTVPKARTACPLFRGDGCAANPADLLAHQAIVDEQRDGRRTRAFRQGTSETNVTVSGRCGSALWRALRGCLPAWLCDRLRAGVRTGAELVRRYCAR